MIAKSSALFLGVMIAAVSFAPAQAADLYGGRGGSIKDEGMPTLMAQSAARFYIRADGSFAQYDRPQITEDHIYDLVDNRIGSNWSAGGGIGYYFNKNIRADLTYEHRFNADVSGSIIDPHATLGGSRSFGLKSDLYLANLYYDFDSRGRFTPYVGAGLGWVDHKTSSGTVVDGCGCTGTIASGSGSSVAAALMAGVAVNLTGRGAPAGSGDGYGGGDAARNLYLDIGYRFLYLGDVSTGAVTANVVPGGGGAGTTVIAADPTVSEIHAHEFRVGLRYDFR
jgi:opacity protein-like surface antigen